MALKLEIVSGILVGSKYKVKEGTSIGRSKGDIVIPDPKISSTHAIVEADSKGKLVLVDQGSSNGVFINEIRVKRVALLPGVKFVIGKTIFKVIEVSDDVLVEPKSAHWRDLLIEEIPRLRLKNHAEESSVKAFQRLVQIEVLTGIQAEQTFVLGFGPRTFGSDTLDIELFDSEAPAKAFELIPDPAGVRFSTQFPNKVTLNHNQISSDLLKDGDKIYLGQTTLLISFKE